MIIIIYSKFARKWNFSSIPACFIKPQQSICRI